MEAQPSSVELDLRAPYRRCVRRRFPSSQEDDPTEALSTSPLTWESCAGAVRGNIGCRAAEPARREPSRFVQRDGLAAIDLRPARVASR